MTMPLSVKNRIVTFFKYSLRTHRPNPRRFSSTIEKSKREVGTVTKRSYSVGVALHPWRLEFRQSSFSM